MTCISFEAYRDFREILILNEDCDLPFHLEKYIRNLKCLRCNKEVTLSAHPSLAEPRWYG